MLTSGQQAQLSDLAQGRTSFTRSFADIGGVKQIAYRRPGLAWNHPDPFRISGTRVGVDLTVRANPELQAFMRRLPRASPEFKRRFRKALRTAAREEFLVPLRPNIPHSREGWHGRRGTRKKVIRVSRGQRIKSTVRGRTQTYGSKKHLRATAKIAKVENERIVITVGSADLWYAAIVHKRHYPFFPATVREVLPALNKRFEKELDYYKDWLANGRRGSIIQTVVGG